MTASLYQKEIDLAEHSKDSVRFTAVETLLKSGTNCFRVRVRGRGPH